MIIHTIRYQKHYFGLLGKHELQIITDEGTGKIPVETLNQEELTLLQKTIPNTPLTTINDLMVLRTKLSTLSPTTYSLFERALLNATKKPWSYFGRETIQQIPRPLCTIAQTPDGTLFHLFAPDAPNIVHTLLTFEAIYDTLKTNNTVQGIIHTTETTEQFLATLEKAIQLQAPLAGIAVKKGITLALPTTLAHAKKLIDDHHLIYIENALPIDNENDYTALTAHAHEHCYIITSSSAFYQKKVTNGYALTYHDALTLKNDLAQFDTDHPNLFLKGDYGLVAIASSLIIPVLVFPLKSALGKTLTHDYLTMHERIRANKTFINTQK